MKNNVIYIEELYSTIRKLLCDAMPYPLTPSVIERDFLQAYTGKWLDDRKVEIELQRNKIICSGEGIDFARDFKEEPPFGVPDYIAKVQNALIFEAQTDQCKHLCDDITAMVKWLLQEEFIVECGPDNLVQYRMTFKFMDRKQLR